MIRRFSAGERVDVDPALADSERGLQRFHDAGALGAADAQTVLNDLQPRVLPGMQSRISLFFKKFYNFFRREVRRHHDRERDHEARVVCRLRTADQVRVYGLRRVARDFAAAPAAVEAGGARVEELQVVVQLGHRADRGARGAHRVGLVDGDGGRDALDGGHLRLVHAVEELPRVRRERFHVAALALRVERVEDKGGFSRARYPGYDDQLVLRQIEVEVLQVVLTCTADADGIARGSGVTGVGRGSGLAASIGHRIGKRAAVARGESYFTRAERAFPLPRFPDMMPAP